MYIISETALKPIVAVRDCFGKGPVKLVRFDIPLHHLAVKSATGEHGHPRVPTAVANSCTMVIELVHKLRSEHICA